MKKIAFKYLIEEKETKSKSKMKNLNYKELHIQKYFKTEKLSTQNKLTLFKARTNMLNVQYNFGQKKKCPLCKIKEDNQEHLIECLIIKIACPEIGYNTNVKYTDIFSDALEKQINISKLLNIAVRTRKVMLTK